MNTEESISEHAEELILFVKQGKDFVVEQAPLYVQELINLEYYGCCSGIAVAVVLLVLPYLVHKWLNNLINGPHDGEEFTIHLLFVVLASTPSFAIICVNVSALMAITLAPRVFILDHLKGLL